MLYEYVNISYYSSYSIISSDLIQKQIRKNLQGAGTTIEVNFFVLFCALFCSIYVLTKHRRGASST